MPEFVVFEGARQSAVTAEMVAEVAVAVAVAVAVVAELLVLAVLAEKEVLPVHSQSTAPTECFPDLGAPPSVSCSFYAWR